MCAQSVYVGLKESAPRREIIENLTRIWWHISNFTVLQIFATIVPSIVFQEQMCFYLTSSVGTKAILLLFDTFVRVLRYLINGIAIQFNQMRACASIMTV